MSTNSLYEKEFKSLTDRIEQIARHNKKNFEDVNQMHLNHEQRLHSAELNFSKMDSKLSYQEKRLDGVEGTIYGSEGQLGLKSQVNNIETAFKIVVSLLKWQIGLLVPIVVTVLGAILAFLFGKL